MVMAGIGGVFGRKSTATQGTVYVDRSLKSEWDISGFIRTLPMEGIISIGSNGPYGRQDSDIPPFRQNSHQLWWWWGGGGERGWGMVEGI